MALGMCHPPRQPVTQQASNDNMDESRCSSLFVLIGNTKEQTLRIRSFFEKKAGKWGD
jgi:hypothetical protein